MDDPPAEPIGMDRPTYYVYIRLPEEELRFILEPDYSHFGSGGWRDDWIKLTRYLWKEDADR